MSRQPRTHEQFVAHFWSRVKVAGDDECWLWTGAVNSDGYGSIWEGSHNWKAHRLSYSLRVGDPGHLCVLHECDNPPCVNPRHLFLGTKIDNWMDMDRKGRRWRPKGSLHPNALLTEEQVQLIRKRYAIGAMRPVLARDYGVSWETIDGIVNRRSWNHI